MTITYTIGFGTLILIVLAFTFEKPTTTDLDVENVLALIGLGVISTSLVFSGYYILLKRAGPLFTSLLGYIAPVFGVIAGVIFLHESIGMIQIIGILLVLLGIFLINIPKLHTAVKQN